MEAGPAAKGRDNEGKMAISTAPDLSGSSRVDILTRPVALELLLQRERRDKMTHDKYLIRGSVGAQALLLPIRRRIIIIMIITKDASFTCFFGLVATCNVRGTCPMQKLPLFFNLIQMRPRKYKISYFGDPQTGEVYKNQVKRQKRMHFFINTIP